MLTTPLVRGESYCLALLLAAVDPSLRVESGRVTYIYRRRVLLLEQSWS